MPKIEIGANVGLKLEAENLAIPGTGNKFTWTVSNGAPFRDYNPTWPTNQYRPWTTYVQTDSNLAGFYSARPAREIRVTCSADLPTCHGTVSLNYSLASVAPDYSTQSATLAIGDFYLVKPIAGGVTSDDVAPEAFRFLNSGFPGGATVTQSVVSLPDFGEGQWNFTQTATVSAATLRLDGDFRYGLPYNSPFLDGGFPYPNAMDNTVSPPRIKRGGGPYPAKSGSAYNGTFADSPGWEDLQNDYSGFYQATFQLYVMYKPADTAAGPSKWVPLLVYPWSCDGDYQSGSPWTKRTLGKSGGVFTTFPPHPTWNQVRLP